MSNRLFSTQSVVDVFPQECSVGQDRKEYICAVYFTLSMRKSTRILGERSDLKHAYHLKRRAPGR
jgi:hypothetical protein